MIIGPNWLLVHIPKSGGTFIRSVLVKVLVKQGMGAFHWLLPFICVFPPLLRQVRPFLLARGGGTILSDPHRPYSTIPPEHKGKTAIVAYRNPCDQLVSSFYYFPDWLTHEGTAECRTWTVSFLKDFPNHSFESWIRFCQGARVDRRLRSIGILRDDLGMDVGFLSFICIRNLLKNPGEILRTMNRDYFISGRYKKDMCDFVKVRTENLNEDLYHALIDLGVRPVHARFLLRTKKRMNVGEKRRGRDWREHYNEDLLDYVLKKEWIWFQMFPEHLEQLKEAFPGYFARNTVKIDAGN